MFGLMPMVVRAQVGAPPPPPPPPDVAPLITSSAPETVYVGQTYTYTPTVTGNPTPTVTPGSLPAWLSWGSGTLSGVVPLSAANVYGSGNASLSMSATNGVAPNAFQEWVLMIAVPAPTGALRVWDSDTRPQPDISVSVNQGVLNYAFPGLRAITARIGYTVLEPTTAYWSLGVGPESAGFGVSFDPGESANFRVDLGTNVLNIDTGIPHAGVDKLAMAVIGCTDGALCVLMSATHTWTHLIPIADFPAGIHSQYFRADLVGDAYIQAAEYWTGAPMTASAAYPSSVVIDWLAAAVAP